MNQQVVWREPVGELNLTLKNGWVLDMWQQSWLEWPPQPRDDYQYLVLNPAALVEPQSDEWYAHLRSYCVGGKLDEVLAELETWLLENEDKMGSEEEIAAIIARVRAHFRPEGE